MAVAKDLARANREDAFMLLGERLRILYDAYQRDSWTGVHDELVNMLRNADRCQDKEADRLAQALRDVLRYQIKGYGLGRCPYISANPAPKGADPDEIEEWEARGGSFTREATVMDPSLAKYFSHFFLSASKKRVPKWCPKHSLSARQKTHREKKSGGQRSGKWI